MKTDYTALDAAILDAIHTGANKFEAMTRSPSVMEYANLIAAEDSKKPSKGFHEPMGWRIVDRRLQALRKAKMIEHAGGRWTIVQSPESKEEA